jgi:Secretion system C-terminal sorting domain
MKTITTFIIVLLFGLKTMAQAEPSCVDMTVDSIAIAPLTGQMKVKIKNNCSNCTSGLNGCVYWEMKVIRTVAPFDTIAASNCWCLQSPDNNTSKNYAFLSSIPILPPLNELRVSFLCGIPGCDTIPFNLALLLPSIQTVSHSYLMPNPVKDNLSLRFIPTDVSMEILDMHGKICISKKVSQLEQVLDCSLLNQGFYLVQIKNKDNQIVRQYKMTKE